MLSVNAELVRLYWDIGRILGDRQRRHGWGAGVIPRLARQLKNELPELRGFSERNIDRMVAFHRAYPEPADFSPPTVAKMTATTRSRSPTRAARLRAAADSGHAGDSLLWSLPWAHHVILMEKEKHLATRRWYMEQALTNGWSRNVLALHLDARAHLRHGKAFSNFAALLPPPQSDLAQQALKDPYVFDFLALTEPFHERELETELVRHLELPSRVRFALVARLKVMADLDIAEHRKPQDGKIDFARYGGPHVELRMVTVPTARGLEDVVLRLLSSLKPMPLDQTGLSERNLRGLRAQMAKAYGLILICGPTGCGKTTTLHSVMRELNTEQRKIWTAEDPIEITQEGLRQVQVNARIGWTFAAAMRTFLRADPDVIMIGEMRDEETARIAVEASLTGHLVMSTLHTNSAAESITRLLEIGLDPFMFSDSLLGVLAQRLVRRLCLHCRVPEPLDSAALESLAQQYLQCGNHEGLTVASLVARWRQAFGSADGRLQRYRRHACEHCQGTGYHGRMGIHELLVADDPLRERIRHRADASLFQAAGLAAGLVTLRQDGIEKVLQGHTDLAEVIAAANN